MGERERKRKNKLIAKACLKTAVIFFITNNVGNMLYELNTIIENNLALSQFTNDNLLYLVYRFYNQINGYVIILIYIIAIYISAKILKKGFEVKGEDI